ncbi:MAG: MFS transporter [Pirellulaceae bacterium]
MSEKRQRTLLDLKRGEHLAFVSAYSWFFLLMAGYQILRPIRESLASELDVPQKSRLFLGTFVVMLIASPTYAWVVSKLTRRQMLYTVFLFFVSNILLFAFWDRFPIPDSRLWLTRVFFVWTSVFSLFATSVFWSVVVDLFSNEQGKRLFGSIASGATLGAIVASAFASFAAELIGQQNLLLLAAGLETGGVLMAGLLGRVTSQWPTVDAETSRRPDGSMLDGFLELIRSRYLLAIAAFLALLSFCGTSNYMKITSVARDAIEDRDKRTAFFASLNLYTQLGTMILQMFIAGFLIRKLGMRFALTLLPCVYFVAFAVGGMFDLLVVWAAIDVVTRMSTYGVTVPAREVLFTVVSRDAKYKAKNFIDTVVFRGSDAVASSVALSVRWLIPFAIGWAGLSWALGRFYRERESAMLANPKSSSEPESR